MSLRVVVAEDSLLVREGIVRLLSTAPDIEVVASCGDYNQVIAAVEDQDPDVVVTDIKMPPTSTDEGIRLAGQLRGRHPSVGVVVLSQYSNPGYVLALFEDGSDRTRLPSQGAAGRPVGPGVGDSVGGRRGIVA